MHQSELLARIWRAIDVEIRSKGHREVEEKYRLLSPDEVRVVPESVRLPSTEQSHGNVPRNQYQNAL